MIGQAGHQEHVIGRKFAGQQAVGRSPVGDIGNPAHRQLLGKSRRTRQGKHRHHAAGHRGDGGQFAVTLFLKLAQERDGAFAGR